MKSQISTLLKTRILAHPSALALSMGSLHGADIDTRATVRIREAATGKILRTLAANAPKALRQIATGVKAGTPPCIV